MVRRLLPLSVAVAFGLLPAVPADAAPTGCRPAGSKTVAQSSRARVYKYEGRFYGCLFAKNRSYRLWARSHTSSLEHVRFAGPYAAYATYVTRDCDRPYVGARSTDLRDGSRGRRIHSVGCGDTTGFTITDLAMRSNGSFGVIRFLRDYEDEADYTQVIKVESPTQVLVDNQYESLGDSEPNPDAIVHDSLVYKHGRLHWKRDSGPISIPLY